MFKKNNFLMVVAFFGILIYTILATINHQTIIEKYQKVIKEKLSLNDSLKLLEVRNTYLDKIYRIHHRTDGSSIKNINFYSLNEDDTKKKINIPFTNRKLVIVRYSSSGCDSCIEMLLRNPNYLMQIKSKYDLAIIVDFKKYDEFKKWQRSTIGPGEKFIWVDESTPLKLDGYVKTGASYIFTVDNNQTIHSLFIPNSSFPEEFVNYINMLSIIN